MGNPTVRRPSRFRQTLRALLAFALLASLQAVAQRGADAAHGVGLFELDGNAMAEAALPGEDWDAVTVATAQHVTDAPKASIFTTGGSKDDLNTTSWRHKDGNVPDKDDLLDAFAARYEHPVTGDAYMYFGADRYASNGDAQVGFWFMQGKVGPQPDGTFGTAGHEIGDVLVLSNFSNGGTQPNIAVYKWDPTSPLAINGTLVELLASVQLNCSGALGIHPACAVVNTSVIDSPWPFAPKNAPANKFQPGMFFEGGINLSDPVFGLGDVCFSSFLAETRSSTSVDATLKDFVAGNLDVCHATFASSPSVGSGVEVTPGTPVTDTLTITGHGVSTPPDPSGSVEFFICGPVASPATCDSSTGTSVGTKTLIGGGDGTASATSASVDTSSFVPGRYCFAITWAGDENYNDGPYEHGGTLDEECFYVAKRDTNTTTTPVGSDGTAAMTIQLGQSISDKAVVTGLAAIGDPTGTVSFWVCDSTELSVAGLCETGGTSLGSKTLTGNGDGTSTTTSDAYTPTAVGKHCFRGVYSGNTVYNGSTDFAANECFTVTDISSLASTQKWLPNDTATLTSAGGSNLNGSLVFTLHDSGDCTGSVLYTEPTINVTNAPSGSSWSTSNSSYYVLATSTVSWKTVFTSSDSTTSSTHCETTSLTINNNDPS